MAQKKELSFVSIRDYSLLNIKENGFTAVTEFTQETYWMYDHPKLISTPGLIVQRSHGNVLKSIEDGTE